MNSRSKVSKSVFLCRDITRSPPKGTHPCEEHARKPSNFEYLDQLYALEPLNAYYATRRTLTQQKDMGARRAPLATDAAIA